MYMRGKFIPILLILLLSVSLCSCSRVISSPGEEIREYSWQSQLENGNEITLSFDGADAALCVDCEDFILDIGGLCVTTDDRLMIYDTDSGTSYSFSYRLYGDRVELSYNDAEVPLFKLDGTE